MSKLSALLQSDQFGAGLAAVGPQVNFTVLRKAFVLPLLLSPILAMAAGSTIYLALRVLRLKAAVTKEMQIAFFIGRPLYQIYAVAGNKGKLLSTVFKRFLFGVAFKVRPDMLIFILLSLVFGRNIAGLLIALGLVSWVRFARITRGQVLQAKAFLFVEGARAMGASRSRVVWRHILPNILGPIIVTLTFSIPSAILAESTLSFIGIGINDPYSPWGTSWGTLAQDGYRAMRTYPHVIFFPAAAIFLTILAFNTLGSLLRDRLDPRGK
jgi:oligopeptide transport system permease protein